jgi:putative SOS response-associated peptidase YedK
MCGRYSLAGPDPSVLREQFALGDQVEVRRRWNVAPGDDVVAVTTDQSGAPRGDVLRWGLVPHWADSPKTGYKMINARAESVTDRPPFRDALATRRCLILADGFYEWERRSGAPKQPWWVSRADGRPFAFAGLWAIWRDPAQDGVEPLRTCTILTTEPNRAIAPIHDRMPVMLAPGAEQAWIDHAMPRAALLELLAPLPEAETAVLAVGPAVNDARYDGPECLAPAPAEEPQATLF